MIKKCKSCKNRFTFMDDDRRFTAIGCLEHGIILQVKKINEDCNSLTIRERVIEDLPCQLTISAESIIHTFQHAIVPAVVDKETALRAIQIAYNQGLSDGKK